VSHYVVKFTGAVETPAAPVKLGETLMTVIGIFLMGVSAVGYFWATNYIGQNALKVGLTSLLGQSDPTFSLAHTVATFSPFTFGLGAVLLIAGLVLRKRKGNPTPS
jgi:hypothetical protein